ncbi:MAG: PQQ-dependent sugar dehydrogenase [Acidobacteriota bacterium]|nr:PQQ-dependent sugar dehydrogenase [Acidobacteriota bacterium]
MRLAAPVLVALLLTVVCAGTVAAQLRTAIVATGFTNPVAFVADPADPATFFVVEQRGTIRSITNGVISSVLFLDLRGQLSSGGERGLLGMAFPPDAATSRRFFINFTNLNGHTVVARYTRDAAGRVNTGSRFDLVWPDGRAFIEQPFSNHNGGHLAFGPDGFLYVGLGDGGSGGDPLNHAQNPNSLLGKMLRLDVGVADTDVRGYRVPEDNPFVDRDPIAALPEIWAFGLRNPWRYSFDDWTRGGTGALVIADVGQSAREEVNWEPRGAGGRNYGWRVREGRLPFDARQPAAYQPLTDPIHEYPRSDGQSITGGVVYRGTALDPMFNGRYFFADYVAGRVYSIGLALDEHQEATAVDLLVLTDLLGGTAELGLISSFGVDASGEMYIVSYSRGRILKIVP